MCVFVGMSPFCAHGAWSLSLKINISAFYTEVRGVGCRCCFLTREFGSCHQTLESVKSRLQASCCTCTCWTPSVSGNVANRCAVSLHQLKRTTRVETNATTRSKCSVEERKGGTLRSIYAKAQEDNLRLLHLLSSSYNRALELTRRHSHK